MEDDLNIILKGWTTSFISSELEIQFFQELTMTSFVLENGRRPQFFWKMEDDLNFIRVEYHLNLFENGR